MKLLNFMKNYGMHLFSNLWARMYSALEKKCSWFNAGIACTESYSMQRIPAQNQISCRDFLHIIIFYARIPCTESYSMQGFPAQNHMYSRQGFPPQNYILCRNSLQRIIFHAGIPCTEYDSAQGMRRANLWISPSQGELSPYPKISYCCTFTVWKMPNFVYPYFDCRKIQTAFF